MFQDMVKPVKGEISDIGRLLMGTAPDVKNTASLAGNATADITVTQKPKLILMIYDNATVYEKSGVFIYDVENDKYTVGWYSDSSSYGMSRVSGFPTSYLSYVGSDKVTIKNGISTTRRLTTFIWY